MVIGGSMAAGHVHSLGPAWRQAGNRVWYMALMRQAEEIFCQTELEAATDQILWLTRSGKRVKQNRAQDVSLQGDFIQVLRDYNLGKLCNMDISRFINLADVDQIYLIGSTDLLRRFQKARQSILKPHLSDKTQFIASVYGPMQCMMKGVCAQCLQWQIDPETGRRTKAVYACSWQHQPMEGIDIDNIDERLSQNHVQEVLANLWLDYIFETTSMHRV